MRWRGGCHRAAAAIVTSSLICGATPAASEPAAGSAGVVMGWLPPNAPDPILSYQTDGSLRMAGSGIRFPSRLGVMPLRRKVAISPHDVMVDYSDRGGGNGDPWLDLIVFDYGTDLAREATRAETGVRARWADLAEADLPLRLPAAAGGARSHWWTGGQAGMRALTGFVMVQRGRWIIEARITAPAPADAGTIAKIQSAIDAIDWQGEPATT